MNRKLIARLYQPAFFILAAALSSCASSSRVTLLDPVGPQPPGVHSSGPLQGYLEVFSATEEYNDGNLMYYPHSSYTVYGQDGSRVRYVDNHIAKNDEAPEKAALPVGKYIVSARSDRDGQVHVPVVIKGGQTTVLHLEQGRASDYGAEGHSADSREVKSPSGQVIGWKASS